ncbi:MAG: type II toxin-antitoxin system VapC family toxin [Hyphomicrobiaceae bacterium]|nr:type II toxin-antitoxin system VapC family toxin [Hyphomicrobiaceae bacterium]
MILPDVNVLISAFRTDAPHHRACFEFLTEALSSRERFGLSPLALSAVVRITTNPRAFNNISTLEEAFEFCNYLSGQPNCQLVSPADKHWHIFQTICLETNTRGRTVTDAWFAALAIEWGCQWVTLDRDFARFPALQWRLLEAR